MHWKKPSDVNVSQLDKSAVNTPLKDAADKG